MSKSRQIQYSAEALATPFDPPEPAADAISSKLWDACQKIATDALESKFMQGLGDGTLDPTIYGQYTVQDCAYCAAAADDYKDLEAAAKKANEPGLASLAKEHYTSYESWVIKTYLPSWHIGNPNALVLNQAAKEYINHERAAVTASHPIYAMVAQIACERLWPWLAEQLKPASPAHNVYAFWISDNYDYKKSYVLSNTIDQWFKSNSDQYDHDTALWALQGSMTGELNLFLSACGQPIVPMPKLPNA